MRPSDPGSAPQEHGRLLLAEDEDSVLVTLEAVLRQAGYDVTSVRSAHEGKQALSRASFDVLVTDLRMEEENSGLDLVREAQRVDPETVAIVLTGYGSFPSAIEALQSGVFDYLTKPSNLEQLKASIARGLEKRRLNRALIETERAEVDRRQFEMHARQATVRAEISAALSERGTLRSMLDRCAEALVKHLDVAYARVWVLNPVENMLELQGTAGERAVSGPLQRRIIRPGQWKIGRAVVERRPVFSQDLGHDAEFSDPAWAARESMHHFAVYPMVVEDRDLGAIALFARQPFAFETLDNMGPLAAAIAQGIDRRRAEDERDRLLLAEREARTRAEAAERRLQQIIDALPEGVLVVDPDGRPLLWNAAAEAVAGAPGSDLDLRRESPVLRHPDGTTAAPRDTPLARAIVAGEITQGQQMTLVHPATGLPVPILINAAPIHDAGGSLLGAVAVFQDISPLKELEQQKIDFLSAAAHDLKTPLTSIKGLVQLLQRQLMRKREAPATATETLAGIDVAATKMAALIDQLLDVSQLDMTRDIDLLPRRTDLLAIATRVIEEQRQGAARHQLRLRTTLTSAIGHWDPDRLERALANLVANAVKYSPDGGEVEISVDRLEEDGRVWAAAAVTDHGVGIPADDLPRIFDRFQRGQNVRGRIAGTGIGLAYVHEIALRHGGSVTVESREGLGSTFTLRLPMEY